jgi:hypothetical protein
MNLRTITFLASLLVPANAFALGSFPGQIKNHLGLSAAPQCNLCHGSISGGGPVVTPLGQAMLAAGLTMSGGSTLTNALDKLAADGTDSDGDGVSDIDELTAGTNANPDKTPIEYGCGGQIATHAPWGWGPSVAGALVFIFVLTRRSGGTNRRFRRYDSVK